MFDCLYKFNQKRKNLPRYSHHKNLELSDFTFLGYYKDYDLYCAPVGPNWVAAKNKDGLCFECIHWRGIYNQKHRSAELIKAWAEAQRLAKEKGIITWSLDEPPVN